MASTNAPSATLPTNDAATNAAPFYSWTFHPLVLTNLAPGPFMENHPETVPGPAERPALSLQSNGSTNASEVASPGASDFSATFHPIASADWGNDLASHLLVVYNANDPDSKGLAEYYAQRRNIPDDRVLAITCPTTEQISRKDYDETIRSPIVTYLSVKDWMVRAPRVVQVGNHMATLLMATRNDIWAIVLMRGVPLKIAQDNDDYFGMEMKPELQTNSAAVDNELALLPVFGLPLGGFVPNVFYDGQPGGIKSIGPELARNMVLVTRLDGPTAADVRRMIDDTIYAEQHRLAGLAVIDTRGLTDEKNSYTSGDDWLRSARDLLIKDGWTVKFDDKPDLIPATDPCNQVAIYLGWYAQDAAGPFFAPPQRFLPGAIAYHLHSFSASTVRSETSNWVGPLIAHGVDATMGMVYEPYLSLTPHEDIFARRLLAGDYFAVAAYASERGLSWMLTVVGDPLYRPFRPTIDEALAQDSTGRSTAHDDWLQLQKVRRGYEQGGAHVDPQQLVNAFDVPGAGPVAHEGLGDFLLEMKNPKGAKLAEHEYRKAADAGLAPIDQIRVAQKLAAYYSSHGESAHARAELDSVRGLYPDDAMRFGVPNPLMPTSVPPAPAPKPAQAPSAVPPVYATPGINVRPQLPQLARPTPGQ